MVIFTFPRPMKRPCNVCGDCPDCCQVCVCVGDPFCRKAAWDGLCVSRAKTGCVSSCTCSETIPSGECCTASGGKGCSDPVCQDCVCADDPYCYDVAWDGLCIYETTHLCGENWGCVLANHGNCCESHVSPGCENPGCEGCVRPNGRATRRGVDIC
ncbi:MAG: hypothetical protein HUU55_21240 [Myxococcales bacterium]|nr:hypothetical protein [Myxococcales bacterium]